MNNISVR